MSPAAGNAYQPYECYVCHSRFTRHENLKRHASLHDQARNDVSLPCGLCPSTFSRPDLRTRHMKRKHADNAGARSPKRSSGLRSSSEARTQSITAIASPKELHTYTSQPIITDNVRDTAPGRLLDLDQNFSANGVSIADCDDGMASDIGLSALPLVPIQIHKTTSSSYPNGSSVDSAMEILARDSNAVRPSSRAASTASSHLSDPCLSHSPLSSSIGLADDSEYPKKRILNKAQLAQGCDLFRQYVAHFLPFIHWPTFDIDETDRHLVLSISSLGFAHEPTSEGFSPSETSYSLSQDCFTEACRLVDHSEAQRDDATRNIGFIQTLLLLEVYAMMYALEEEKSSYGLRLHSKITSLSRVTGLLQPLFSEASLGENLENLWKNFVAAESHKRTLFAIHQVDTIWYQLLSIPRTLSHLEIKHDLPCSQNLWTAESCSQWAHRRLIAPQSNDPTQYTEVIRSLLSPEPRDIIPPFDNYGTINLTQFLTSSAREISGWSSMTGIVSMERMTPLKNALHALESYIRSDNNTSSPAENALCEATWESAMIEVLLWSPSHTGGIVECSIEAYLHQLTFLGPGCEFWCRPETASLIQPHVNWFLRYLDTTEDVESEAPWIMVYAFKAFMVGWQLLQGMVADAMKAVGISRCDYDAAITWGRKVFARRQRYRLGRIIMACLNTLEKPLE